MGSRISSSWLLIAALGLLDVSAAAQQSGGSIRGLVQDEDFDAPLAGAQVTVVETGQQALTGDQGHYVLGPVPAGVYTLVFAKEGYIRQVKADVRVAAGQLTEVDMALTGEFTDMEEFVVQDVMLGLGSELAMLSLRLESPALMNSIGADLISKAGASDAAAALRLVPGASVAEGKSAVIRGLPDRYVSSQMNGVRLPTADEDKRAVELDQFPAVVIESIQVSKTFTPDQQGDASGGAVNVRLRGIPSEALVQLKGQIGYNSQVTGNDDFLSYDGGGLTAFGYDDGSRDIQWDNLGGNWDGAAGTNEIDAPIDSKWQAAIGGTHELDSGWRIGGSASLFYERDSSSYDDGVDDSYWVETPGGPMTPQYSQGTPSLGSFFTSLFDVEQSTQSVQWGGLGTVGLENEHHSIGLTYLYTHIAEDTATLATDTRGKQYFFPGYDPGDPNGPGNGQDDWLAAPYLRLETLEYTERTTSTLQLSGRHDLPMEGFGAERPPELEWIVASSYADLNQPDKRQFGAWWIPFHSTGELWGPLKPGENINLGNFQRIWKDISEDSGELAANLTFPFEQWSEQEGFVKFGVFADRVDRQFNQDTFSNLGDNTSSNGAWEDPWSAVFPSENHPIFESLYDVDYDGEQDISALYGMMDLPLSSSVKLIGGARFESTEISIVNDPEQFAFWFPAGATNPVTLLPGEADVDFQQDDILPSVELVVEPVEHLTLRTAYSQTVARQTFKELTPILQQEYLGGPIFIGNPSLQMSNLRNYDLRADYSPYAGGLLSASWFYKDIDDPIEYVQKLSSSFDYTTADNYPEGELYGYELELRQELGQLADSLAGMVLGANATFIQSEVTLSATEAASFNVPGIEAPMSSRDMTNAPDHLFNFFVTYELESTGTQLGVFYTVQGDTLIAGAGQSSGFFVPSVYALEFGTLNMTVTQRLGRFFQLQLQAKNLTNPELETVYRSQYIGSDVLKTSYTAGIDVSLSLGARFSL